MGHDLEATLTTADDGSRPLDVTAKNGAPGGSFCVWQGDGRARQKRRDRRLLRGFSGVFGCGSAGHIPVAAQMVAAGRAWCVGWRYEGMATVAAHGRGGGVCRGVKRGVK